MIPNKSMLFSYTVDCDWQMLPNINIKLIFQTPFVTYFIIVKTHSQKKWFCLKTNNLT